MKCATVTFIGRPSTGKSTLVNTICEQKVSIVSTTPQTTRNVIRGIYTDQRGQLIFSDTPGFHLSEQKLNQKLQETTRSSLKESDIILYLIDPKREAKEEEETIVKLLLSLKIPTVVAINKIDIASKNELTATREFLAKSFKNILEISAQNDEGVDELLIELFKLAPQGPLMYPPEAYTDQPLEFRISEIIREKAIKEVIEELPHAIYVEVADLEYSQEDDSVWIRAFINVEKESQKGIVVGKGGSGIKKIRQASFKEIRRIFAQKNLHLDLRVKTHPKWRKSQTALDRLL
ncbi:MAG: GTPase Era [Sphaerochaetaceae bacterium]